MSYEYETIEKAIHYLNTHVQQQPDLDTLAEKMNLSPFHFQRMFTSWAGVSPKKFLQYLNISYAKHLLRKEQQTLFSTALELGLSGTGRLHDLFISIEGMSPAEYKNGGRALCISYSMQDTPFGTILVASTERGVCYLAFTALDKEPLLALRSMFPNASFLSAADATHLEAKSLFTAELSCPASLRLHLKGTAFQLKVWQALLSIPSGGVSTYSNLAGSIGHRTASRAVGTAIGANPVAYLIPCHRVIKATGLTGGYHWGPIRKQAILGWEASQLELQR